MNISSDVTETPGLRFDSQQDMLDHVGKQVEKWNRWLSLNTFNLVKRYENRKLDFVIRLCIGPERRYFDLLFGSVPDVFKGHTDQATASALEFGCNVPGSHYDGDQDSVIVSVAYLVQGPEGNIPSLVRLERPKERVNFLREIGPLHGVFKITGSSSEREVCMSRIERSSGDGDRVGGVVQGLPEVVGGVPGDLREILRKSPLELDLVYVLLRSIRVGINRSVAWVIRDEPVDFLCEFENVMLCPSQLSA